MTTDIMPPTDQQPPNPRRRWLRFSLRSLLLLVVVIAIPLAWKVSKTRNRRFVVAELRKLDGQLLYDYQIVEESGDRAYRHLPPESELPPPGPKWLTDLLGKECFVGVAQVTVGPKGTNEALALIARLPEVEYVNLIWPSGITDGGLAHFAGMDNLEQIILFSNRITGSGLVHLAALKRLKTLLVSGWVSDASLEHISTLKRLETLLLFETGAITDIGIAHIKTLPNLRTLCLGGGRRNVSGVVQDCVQISDEGLANLYGLTNLEFLDLNSTQATQAGIDRLRKALPNCQISWNLEGRPTPFDGDGGVSDSDTGKSGRGHD